MKVREHSVGILLAGGKSSRMGGGDKCLLPLAGRPILAHVIERLKPQVAELIISAQRRVDTLLGLRLAGCRRSARGLCRASCRHSCRT